MDKKSQNKGERYYSPRLQKQNLSFFQRGKTLLEKEY